MAAAPLLSPGAFPAVIVPSLRNAGLSLASTSSVVSGRFASSRSKVSGPLSPLTSTPTISAEAARRLRRGEALLRTLRPAILVLARNPVANDQVFGVPARMLARERVVEPIAQH